MTSNILVCANCSSEDIETCEDSETGEIFHICNTCEFNWNEGHKLWFE